MGTKTRTIGDRAFCAAAPRLWNALPEHLRAPQTTDGFKKSLKTYLFKKSFNVENIWGLHKQLIFMFLLVLKLC